jgi:hypothetical protein
MKSALAPLLSPLDAPLLPRPPPTQPRCIACLTVQRALQLRRRRRNMEELHRLLTVVTTVRQTQHHLQVAPSTNAAPRVRRTPPGKRASLPFRTALAPLACGARARVALAAQGTDRFPLLRRRRFDD